MAELTGEELTSATQVEVTSVSGAGVMKLHILLDQSGSMRGMNDTAYAGVREMIQSEPDNSWVSLTTFSSTVHMSPPLNKDAALAATSSRRAEGCTALYDAIVRVITAEEEMSEPDDVLSIVIVTDGVDTASVATQTEAREAIIRAQQRGWRCLFMGSGQDAVMSAQAIGIPVAEALTYGTTEEAMRSAFNAATDSNTRFRSLGREESGFTEVERTRSLA